MSVFYMIIAGSLIAIVVLAAIAGWLFPVSKTLSRERCERLFQFTFPDIQISAIHFSSDKKAAIIETNEDTQFGFVTQPGDRMVCRLFAFSEIENIMTTQKGHTIKFSDFTQPSVLFSGAESAQENAINFIKSKRLEHAS